MRTNSPPNISLYTVARRRARITPDLKNILEVEYQKNPNPKKADKLRIAEELSMSTNSVHFWFQNRRAEESKKKKRLREMQKNTTSSDNNQDNNHNNHNNDCNDHPKDVDYNTQQHQYHYNRYQQQQQQFHYSKAQNQLPSIATLLAHNNNSLYLPNEISMVDFYFHHHHYGVGSCFVKWQVP